MRYKGKRRLVELRRWWRSRMSGCIVGLRQWWQGGRNRSRFISGAVVATLSLLLFLLLFAIVSVFFGGDEPAKTAAAVSPEVAEKSSVKVIGLLVATILICFGVAVIRRPIRRFAGAISDMAPVWGWIAGIIAVNVLFSGFFPEAYNWFRNESGFFWETVLGVVAVSALSTTFKGSLVPYAVGGMIALAWLNSAGITDWLSDDSPEEEVLHWRGAGAELSAEKLPAPAWQYFEGPEKGLVMSAFPADTTMWAIAACESRFRQFGVNGEVLRGEINPRDIGLFQINDSIHAELIKSLVEEDSVLYDITTPAGNIAVAKILANRDGYRPWSASAWCWQSNYARRPTSLASSPQTPQSVRGVAYTEIRRDSAVFVPAGGGWSAPVGIPPTHFLSRFSPARSSDSLFIRSPSGRVYVLPPNGKVNMSHEVGRWHFRISDTSSVDMEVYVTRAVIRR